MAAPGPTPQEQEEAMLKQLQGVASMLQSVRLMELWRYVTPTMVTAFNWQVAREVPVDSAMVDAVVGLLERERARQQRETAEQPARQQRETAEQPARQQRETAEQQVRLEREAAEQQAKTAFEMHIGTAISARGDSTVLMLGLGQVGINYLWDHYRVFGDETILKFLPQSLAAETLRNLLLFVWFWKAGHRRGIALCLSMAMGFHWVCVGVFTGLRPQEGYEPDKRARADDMPAGSRPPSQDVPPLPGELWAAILSSLADWRDLARASAVCHLFRSIAADPRLWRDALRASARTTGTAAYIVPVDAGLLASWRAWTDAATDEGLTRDAVPPMMEESAWDWRRVCEACVAIDTLDEALELARQQSVVVLVAPGRYASPVQLRGSAVLVGMPLALGPATRGPFEPLGARDSPAPDEALPVVLANVSVSLQSPSETVFLCGIGISAARDALSVTAGTAVVVGCQLTSRERYCATVTGSGRLFCADSFMYGKAGGARGGVYAQGGRLQLLRTRLTAFDGTGVSIVGSASAFDICACQIDSHTQFGVYLSACTGVISDSDVHSTLLSCVVGRDRARVTMRRCQLRDSKQCGLLLAINGEASLDDCTLTRNEFTAAESRQSGQLTLRGCRVTHGAQHGVCCMESGLLLDACEVTDNALAGVMIKSKATAELRNSSVSSNRRSGVFIAEGSSAVMSGCRLERNECGAVRIKGELEARDNIIRHNNGGLQALEAAAVLRESGNVLFGNEVVAPEVLKAISRNVCTYFGTGAAYMPQYWYHCYTCDSAEDTGCCVVCAEKCHKGHNLGAIRFTTFFCDCYPKWGKCCCAPLVGDITIFDGE
eukprot:m51a1_g4243 hypothetical protein (832) ;mRNA; f:182765-186506